MAEFADGGDGGVDGYLATHNTDTDPKSVGGGGDDDDGGYVFGGTPTASTPAATPVKPASAAVFPAVAPLDLSKAKNAKNAKKRPRRPGDRPTRRATLFGTVVAVYRTAICEGFSTLHHCLGDDVTDVSQGLRQRRSDVMHRPAPYEPLYYDMMPGRRTQPRFLPKPQGPPGLGGLLDAMQVTVLLNPCV
jgi:hypothetical protein